MIFRPSRIVPILLIIATLVFVFPVFAPLLGFQRFGEHFNIIGFVSVSGISITAWIHFFHRRKVWEDSLKDESRRLAGFPTTPEAEFDATTCRARAQREIAYVLDGLNLMRALRDRKRDKMIEAADPKRQRNLITLEQERAKAANFLQETYRKLPPAQQSG